MSDVYVVFDEGGNVLDVCSSVEAAKSTIEFVARRYDMNISHGGMSADKDCGASSVMAVRHTLNCYAWRTDNGQ